MLLLCRLASPKALYEIESIYFDIYVNICVSRCIWYTRKLIKRIKLRNIVIVVLIRKKSSDNDDFVTSHYIRYWYLLLSKGSENPVYRATTVVECKAAALQVSKVLRKIEKTRKFYKVKFHRSSVYLTFFRLQLTCLIMLERNTTIDHRLVFVLLVYYHTRCYKVT